MFPCREDHIITLQFYQGLGASDRLILLSFEMVVEPSSFEAWLLIVLVFTLGCPSNSPSFSIRVTPKSSHLLRVCFLDVVDFECEIVRLVDD